MPIDLSNLNAGTWFPYPDEERAVDGEKVCMRRLNHTASKNITDQTDVVRSEFRQPLKANGKVNKRVPPQRVEWVETKDPEKKEEMIWDYTITDWILFDQNKKKIPCNAKLKFQLMREDSVFPIFWADSLEALDTIEEKEQDEKTKNLLSSQSEQ